MPSEPDGLRIAIRQEPIGLSPIFDAQMVSVTIQAAMLRDLVAMDDTWHYHPELCEEIPTFENRLWQVETQPDGSFKSMTVTWRLREDVTWEDGVPITSHDFKFAWNVVMASEDIPSRDVAQRIADIDDSNPKLIVVHWKEPYVLANLGISGLLPAHKLEQGFRRNPQYLRKHHSRIQPLANGPYRLAEWKSDQYIKLESNPRWWGHPPSFKTLTFRLLPERQRLADALMTGEIDAVASGVLDAEQLEPLLQMPSSAFSVRVDQGMSWEHIDLNFDNPIINPPANPGAGKKLRQALIYAVDRDAVNLAVYGGRNTVVNGWLPQRHYGFAKATRNYVYDPSLAEKLLTEAGWSLKAGEDIRTDATGRKLELELVTTAGNPQRENVQAILQKYWRALGINVIIKTDPTRHFFSETLGKREFKALALYAFTFSPTVTGENLWTSTNIPSEVNQWHGQNFPGYRNQEIDHLLSVIPVTLDKPRRVELFRRQQELWIDELPALPLFFGTNVTVYPTGCKNWRPTGTAQPETWNVEHWTCPSLADLRPDNGVKE